jgi:epsilon-lactone hydrolase
MGGPQVLQVSARDIPVPISISPEAQAVLAQGALPESELPAIDDVGAWKALVDFASEFITADFETKAGHLPVVAERRDVDGVGVFDLRPEPFDATDRRVYLDIHGGALLYGAGECCRLMGTLMAAGLGLHTWAVDYRMPPEHPYPAPLDDCLCVYRSLLEQRNADEIVVGGTSAGGNLAAALVLRARDEGLALPAAVLLLSPEVDLTESGDSFQTNLGVDTVLRGSLLPINLLYASGHDLHDPYLSPLFGDFSRGYAPTLLYSGTRDLFLSNAVRFHRSLRNAGVRAELHVQEAAPHGGFMVDAPEDRDLYAELRRFVNQHCSREDETP